MFLQVGNKYAENIDEISFSGDAGKHKGYGFFKVSGFGLSGCLYAIR
jgi:hypothetical protein